MKKAYFIGVILFLMLCLNIAYAGPTVKQYGKLIDVEKTGQVDGDRYQVIVTMEINGVTIYLTMWMTDNEFNEINKQSNKGRMITIYYHWDGNGRRIYDGFKYGNPDGIQYPPTISVPEELKHRHGALNSPIPIDPNW